MPRCTYCTPEVASFGMTEAQAKAAGHEIKVGKFPFLPNGKAQAINVKEGFVKLVVTPNMVKFLAHTWWGQK